MKAYFKAEDEMEAKRYAKALDMALALFEIGQYLRSQLKWAENPSVTEEARDHFYAILDQYNIDLEEIIR